MPDEAELRLRAQARLRRRSVVLMILLPATIIAGVTIGAFRVDRSAHSTLYMVTAAGGVLLVFVAMYLSGLPEVMSVTLPS
jgi:hypothetical protein